MIRKKQKVIIFFLVFFLTLCFQSCEEKQEKPVLKPNPKLLQMIRIPSGKYWVGKKKVSDNSLRLIELPSYQISKYNVTNRQYLYFLKQSGYKVKGNYDREKSYYNAYKPAVGLTYEDALAYVKFCGLDLPTEWQWEVAARGMKKDYPFTKSIHYSFDYKDSAVISVFKSYINSIGLYGMAGNVFEWTKSFYDKEKKIMVLRGGAWTNSVHDIAPWVRTPFPKKNSLLWLGFRCVKNREKDKNE